MQEQWHMSTDTAEAAAFAALGATIKIVANLHQRTSTREVRLFISPHTTGNAWRIGKIRSAMKHGTLVRAEPSHPYLTCRRALANREAILDIQNKGSRYHLLPVPHTSGIHQYMPCPDGLPGIRPGTTVVRTTDLKIAAALATAGFPLLAIDGSAREHTYTLAAFQIPAAPVDAATLVSQWRADASTMPFTLPFVQAATALLFRQQLRLQISKSIDTILIHKPRTTSHAAIRADAAPQAWDQIAHFFNGTR